jgi:hypothetical protein
MTFLEMAKKAIENRSGLVKTIPACMISNPNTRNYQIVDDPQERAAILEYYANLPRTEAERRAGLNN